MSSLAPNFTVPESSAATITPIEMTKVNTSNPVSILADPQQVQQRREDGTILQSTWQGDIWPKAIFHRSLWQAAGIA